MRRSWTYRLVGLAAAAAMGGLIMAACGDSEGSPDTAARATAALTASVQQAAPPQDTSGADAPTATPEVQPETIQEAPAAAAPGARPGGAGLFAGRFGGAGLVDAVAAAVAEITGQPVEAVQALRESGLTFAEILEAEGADREAVVDQVVEQIQSSFPGGRGGQAGGARPGGDGAGGDGAGGGGGGAGFGGAGLDPRAALSQAVNALIDGEEPAPSDGAAPARGLAQVVVDIVAERTGRDAVEVRELRAGGQSFASLLFMAGQDLDAAIDAIVEALQTNAAAAARPQGAPTPPSGEGLRAAIEAIMFATDDSEAEPAPSPTQEP